jgi:hypothetical protein
VQISTAPARRVRAIDRLTAFPRAAVSNSIERCVKESTFEIDCQRPFKKTFIYFWKRCARHRIAGIVDEDVKPSELLQHSIDQCIRSLLGPQVGRYGFCFAAIVSVFGNETAGLFLFLGTHA